MCPSVKLVMVGDYSVGKTCLLITYALKDFPTVYIPSMFDTPYPLKVVVDGTEVTLNLWDQQDLEKFRPLSFPETDVFLFCFAVENPESFQNIESTWLPFVRQHSPHVPIILVACKTDLRSGDPDASVTTDGKPLVTYSEGLALAKKLGVKYFETSAMKDLWLKACFDEAVLPCAGSFRLDLRSGDPDASVTTDGKPLVTYSEGLALAKKLGVKYFETSAMKDLWLKACFDEAVRTGLNSPKCKKSKTRFRRKEIPPPPALPPPDPAPDIEISTSTFGEDWYQMLRNATDCDITFVLEGHRTIDAHKMIVASSSTFFEKILCSSAETQSIEEKTSTHNRYNEENLNSGAIPGIRKISGSEDSGRQITTIELSEDISYSTFERILNFLYSGNPILCDDCDTADIQELRRVAGLFDVIQLQTICDNILNDVTFLNPSITTYQNSMTAARMKKLFFNQPDIADTKFLVNDSTISAHKVVLCARCGVMAAMFRGNFMEGLQNMSEITIPETTPECFSAFLEYLYTDHAPVEEVDVASLLVLADKYGVNRLINLCELFIMTEIKRSLSQHIDSTETDVINILQAAQKHNATQLSNWCLHYIGNNYTDFQGRNELSMLTLDSREHVEEHRWPPTSYLNEKALYDQKYGDKKKTGCQIL